jgi:hypothetical protein
VSWKLNILFIMFKIIAFFIITLSVRLYTRVGILFTCGKHLHDHISLVVSERSERVTNFIFCRAGWYFSVSIIFTFR